MMSKFIVRIIALLASLLVLAAAHPQPGLNAVTPYSFEDIFETSLRPNGFSATWIKGQNAFYYRNSTSGNVMRRDAQTQEERVLVPSSHFEALNTGTYFMSSDVRYALIAYETESLWRHSFSAKYEMLDINTGLRTPFPNGVLSGTSISYANWAPGNKLSFVDKNNNLYYQPGPGAGNQPRAVTSDGHVTDVFNGVPDWLYEEDVLGDRVTHYWSPDSRYIVYARIDVSHVPFISWPIYGLKSDVYGRTVEIRYPKAGDVRNGQPGNTSVAQLFLFDTTTPLQPAVKIVPPAMFSDVDHYFVQVAWANATRFYVTWTNRVQNHSRGTYYDVTNPDTPVDGHEFEISGGWVEVAPIEPIFIDPDTYVTIHPRDRGTTGSWRQVAVYSASANNVTFISEDIDEEVDNLYGYDSQNGYVYYSGTQGDATERHIIRASVTGASAPLCLTCAAPDSCRYITSSFSESGSYYFMNCRGPEIPTYSLKSTLPGEEGLNVIMENNDAVRELLAQKALPTRDFRKIKIGGEYMADAEIFIPPDHVEGNTYPLLIYAYAGPGSQRVMKTFPFGSSTSNWLNYLKSTHKVVVVSVDSRGASGRGDKFKFEMYKNLGTVEVQDQIEAGRVFGVDSLVNKNLRKGIFGWSYGGGTAAHVIGDSTDVVTCGISVAPVTTKMYYDTAYTERYLGLATPTDGEAAYNNTDVMNKVNNFKNKKFMLNHGMADDNVHYMHTTQLIQALADADIPFRQNAFIDQNHGITSPGPSRYLYHVMTDFLLEDCGWGNQPTEEVSGATSTTLGRGSYVILLIAIVQILLQI